MTEQLAMAHSTPAIVPHQSQPIATFQHRPISGKKLAERRQQTENVLSFTPYPSSITSAANQPPPTIPSLMMLIEPHHRWSSHPNELVTLFERLLRGHTTPWNIYIYTSRAKLLRHATCMQQRPKRDRHAKEIPVIEAIITTLQPLLMYEQVAKPLKLPLIYFGTDDQARMDISANMMKLPYACSRLDEVLACATKIHTKNDSHRSLQNNLGGLLGTGVTSLFPSKRSWSEYVEPSLDDQPPQDDSRPTSPATIQRLVEEVRERHQKQQASEEAAQAVEAAEKEEIEQESENMRQEILQNLPPTAQAAFKSGHRLRLADAAPMMKSNEFNQNRSPPPPSTSRQVTSPPPPPPVSRLVTSPHRQLQVEIPAGVSARDRPPVLQILSPSQRTNLPPQQPQPSTTPHGVKFSASTKSGDANTTKHADGAKSDSTTTPAANPPAAVPRTARNPFGTVDGQPPPNFQFQPKRSASARTLTQRPTPLAAPLTLSVETPEDTARLKAIHELSLKLNAYSLPPPKSTSTPSTKSYSKLPANTAEGRLAAYEAELNSSHIIGASTRALLLADRAREESAARRHLRREEKIQEEKVLTHQAQQEEWRRQQETSLWELRQTKEKEFAMEEEAKVERFLGEQAYHASQLLAHRQALEDEKKQKVLDRIKEFNESQSTARAVALNKVPNAPELTNLQAVFLSPRSRKAVGLKVIAEEDAQQQAQPNNQPMSPQQQILRKDFRLRNVIPPTKPTTTLSIEVPTDAKTDSNTTPIKALIQSAKSPPTHSRSPSLQQLATQHLPSRQAIEDALRADYHLLEERRRIKESHRMELEAVMWRKKHEYAVKKELEKYSKAALRAKREERLVNEKAEKAELRQLLKEAFDSGSEEEEEEEEDEDEDQLEGDDDYDQMEVEDLVEEDLVYQDHLASKAQSQQQLQDSMAITGLEGNLERIQQLRNAVTVVEVSGTNSLQSSPPTSSRVKPTLHRTKSGKKKFKQLPLFDLLSPELHHKSSKEWQAAQAAQQLAAEREALARQRESEEIAQELQKQAEREAAWKKKHPPVPIELLSRRRHVERRNPHEWQHVAQIGRGEG